MKHQLAFGSLLLATTQLIAPAALAQVTGSEGTPTPPPAGTVAQSGADQSAQPQDQPAAQERQVETSTPGAEYGNDIVVQGRNIPNIVRATPQVVSVLGAEDIARTGEGDIAGALQRVTGLSVVGNGYVYVRGLGDRYSSSMLNGSPLPSPEPLKRVVPLDIFPTNIIASALVQKSYSANYPGEFGGGVINLTTRAVPEEAFVQLEAQVGFDTETTSELGYVYDGGESDFFGYDSGERDVPPQILAAGQNRVALLHSADLTNMSNAPTTLLQQNPHIAPNQKYEISFGGSTDAGGVRIGLIAAGGFDNNWKTRDAIQQYSGDNDGGLTSDFHTITTENRVIVSGMLGIGIEFGEHKIRLTNLYIHDTLKQASLGAGGAGNNFDVVNGNQPFIDQSTAWFERQLLDFQAAGEFKFDDLSVDLRGTRANTKRKSPYERAFRYEYLTTIFTTPVNDYIDSLGSNTPTTVAFSDLNEDLWSGQADLSYKFNTSFPLSASAGYYYSDSDRQSSRYSFQYFGPNGGSLPLVLAQLRPDYLLSDDTILNGCVRWIPGYTNAGNCIELHNTSANTGAAEYAAELTIQAGYAQLEGEPIDNVRATLGVRYEDGDETVTTTGVTGTEIQNSYWLPAATVTWNFAEDMQLRLHGSKTIARPQFRELAPQIYQDYETNRSFLGNPLLNDSTLLNFEARGEWFFARDQRLTVAGFYKTIDHPIEQVAFFPAGAQTPTVGFSYAPKAKLYGAEVEFQHYTPMDTIFSGPFWATRRFLVAANYTYTQSQLEVDDSLVPAPLQGAVPSYLPANNLFVDGDPLVGQSDHLVNLQVGVEDTEQLSQLTVMFNYASQRVTARGPVPPSGTGVPEPNFVETPGVTLDVVARQGFEIEGVGFELKFEGRNLLHTPHEEFQQFPNGVRRDINTYDLGRIFTVGISAKL